MKIMSASDDIQQRDADLITRIAGGDQQAFAALFHSYAPRLKGYFLNGAAPGMTEALAEELVQETLLKIWSKAHTFDARRARVSTWIYTVARNCRIDHFYRRQAEQLPLVDAESVWSSLESEQAPQDELQCWRDRQRVIGSMAHLPDEQREVVQKVYMESKSHAAVASELRVPLGTVKSRVRLALGRLKVLLES